MKQDITVKYTDGRELTATLGPKQFVEFERHFSTKDRQVSVTDLAESAKAEWLYYLAFLGMKLLHANGQHEGAIKASFEDFLDILEDVDLGEDQAPLAETVSSPM